MATTKPNDRTRTEHLGYVWDLLAILVQKEIKLRYRGTVLGLVWSLANPLAFALVLHFAFKRVLKVDIDNYAVFILAALFPWQWFTNSLRVGARTFIENGPLLKKLPFPRITLGTAVVLGDLTHFLMTIPVFAALLFISDMEFKLATWVIGFPLLLLIQMVHTIALVTIIGCVNAFLRDLEQFVNVLLLLLFYVTPILYPVSMVPEKLHWALLLNPISPLLIAWRELLSENTLSPYIGWALLHMLIAVAIAIPVYRRLQWRLAEVI